LGGGWLRRQYPLPIVLWEQTIATMDDIFKRLTAVDAEKRSRWRPPHQWCLSTDEGPAIQPDGGFIARLQILSCFLVNINNWRLVNTFGVFQAFYETSFLSDCSPSAISWIGTV
jgi:hypothetical protein